MLFRSVQRLEALGVPFPMEFGTDLILKSLPPSYAGFVMNFNMHGMNKTLGELFAMLKVALLLYRRGYDLPQTYAML